MISRFTFCVRSASSASSPPRRHIRYVICLDVHDTWKEEQFLISGARGTAEALFGLVERVGLAARNHQQGRSMWYMSAEASKAISFTKLLLV